MQQRQLISTRPPKNILSTCSERIPFIVDPYKHPKPSISDVFSQQKCPGCPSNRPPEKLDSKRAIKQQGCSCPKIGRRLSIHLFKKSWRCAKKGTGGCTGIRGVSNSYLQVEIWRKNTEINPHLAVKIQRFLKGFVGLTGSIQSRGGW